MIEVSMYALLVPLSASFPACWRIASPVLGSQSRRCAAQRSTRLMRSRSGGRHGTPLRLLNFQVATEPAVRSE